MITDEQKSEKNEREPDKRHVDRDSMQHAMKSKDER